MDSKKRKKGSKDTKTTPKKVKSSDLPPQINIFNDDSFSTPSYITETQSIYEIHPTLIYPGNINESNMNYMPYSNQINNEEVKKTTKTSQSNKKSSSKAKTKRSTPNTKGITYVCAHPEHDILFPDLPREQNASNFYPTSKTKCKRCYIHDQMERQKTRKVKSIEKLIPSSTMIGKKQKGNGEINSATPILPPTSSIGNQTPSNPDVIEVDVIVNNSLYGEPYVIHSVEEKKVEIVRGDPLKVKQYCLPLLDKLIEHPHSFPFVNQEEKDNAKSDLSLSIIRERLYTAGTTLKISRPRGRPPSTPQPDIPSFPSFQSLPKALNIEGFSKISVETNPVKKTPKPKAKPKTKQPPKKQEMPNTNNLQNLKFEDIYSHVSSEAIYPGLNSTDENPFPTIQSLGISTPIEQENNSQEENKNDMQEDSQEDEEIENENSNQVEQENEKNFTINLENQSESIYHLSNSQNEQFQSEFNQNLITPSKGDSNFDTSGQGDVFATPLPSSAQSYKLKVGG